MMSERHSIPNCCGQKSVQVPGNSLALCTIVSVLVPGVPYTDNSKGSRIIELITKGYTNQNSSTLCLNSSTIVGVYE